MSQAVSLLPVPNFPAGTDEFSVGQWHTQFGQARWVLGLAAGIAAEQGE